MSASSSPGPRRRVRGRADGSTPPAEQGSVTAETAVVLPVLVLVLAVLVFVLACVSAQLQCVDAARSAARLAARGEPATVVQDRARDAAPRGAAVRVTRDGDQVLVVVEATVTPFGRVAGRLSRVAVSGRAAALAEDTVGVDISIGAGPDAAPGPSS